MGQEPKKPASSALQPVASAGMEFANLIPMVKGRACLQESKFYPADFPLAAYPHVPQASDAGHGDHLDRDLVGGFPDETLAS